MNNLPFVSVIVPAYNSEVTIGNLLGSLLNQSYPSSLIEIIVVDNNSSDNTKEVVNKFPVTLLEEKDIQSSYAARNMGIKIARGTVLAFIDADCIANPNWIDEGINVMESERADLVGGKVEFLFSESKTPAEMYDSIMHFNMELYIKNMKACGAGNLFVKLAVFKDMGMFSQDVRSGGDIQFTYKAVMNGYILVYAPSAIVLHPTRGLSELIKKSYRVGSGVIDIMTNRNEGKIKIIYVIIRNFLPQKISYIKAQIEQRGTKEMKKYLLTIWAVSYLCSISRGLGILSQCRKLFI